MARSARCDVRRGAAVFVESDEMTVPKYQLWSRSFRRLLLQIGGANIAGAERALAIKHRVTTEITCGPLRLRKPLAIGRS
jgi:23S rRNA G2445 N2-methylase RlmL